MQTIGCNDPEGHLNGPFMIARRIARLVACLMLCNQRKPAFGIECLPWFFFCCILLVGSKIFAAEQGLIDPWSLENPEKRASLPLYKIIVAAPISELTPAISSDSIQRFSAGDWHRSHGNHASNRYAALDQIDRENVRQLKVAWTYHSKDGKSNIQCNPIAVDGIVYAPTVGGYVVAIDGATGIEQWRFKPEGIPAFRGLTWWGKASDRKPRLLFNAGDWLYMLDPESGLPFETFGESGRIRTGHFRVAPAIHGRVILIAGYDGDAFGYDLMTGKLLWTFHTKPRVGEFGHETWNHIESGANCWSGTALDEARGIFYMTTGSPKPNFVGTGHLGDNLFSNCVLALDARNGTRLWHFQEIRHDIWDLDLPAPPVLVTVNREGKQVDAVAAVSKIGNTLLLDRVTGSPLFPFRLKRAPVSKLHGEVTAVYQPDLQWPQPFSRQRFGLDQITHISEEARQSVLDQLKGTESGVEVNAGWFEPFEAGRPTALFGIHGGAEWTGASFDPETGFLYVTSNELPWFPTVSRIPLTSNEGDAPPSEGRKVYQQHCMVCHGSAREGIGVNPPLIQVHKRKTETEIRTLLKTGKNLMPAAEMLDENMTKDLLDYILGRDRNSATMDTAKEFKPAYTYNGYPKLLDHEGFPGCKPPWGTLNCIDLNHGILRWQVPLGEHRILTERGISVTGTENFGGATVTSGGLVFAAGTRDQKIRAFDKETGEELWSHELPFGGFAPPTSYLAGEQQFILIPATGGGKLGGSQGDAYVAFSLKR